MNDQTNNPWKTREQRYVHRDPWIRVRVDSVIRPDGSAGTYSVVELKGGVGVVARDSSGRILLVGQYRYAPDCYSWEIPKGAFDSFDYRGDANVTAIRELVEETGAIAEDWVQIGVVHTLLGSTNDRVYLYSAIVTKNVEATPEPTEVICVKWVTDDEFWAMVSSREISDATSIAAVGLDNRRRP